MKLFSLNQDMKIEVNQEAVNHIINSDTIGAVKIRDLVLKRWHHKAYDNLPLNDENNELLLYLFDEDMGGFNDQEKELFIEIITINNLFLTTDEFFVLNSIINQILDKN